MAVRRRRNAVTTISENGVSRLDCSGWMGTMYSNVLNDWNRGIALLNSPTRFQTRNEIRLKLAELLPHLARQKNHDFKKTTLDPLKKIGLLDVDLTESEKRYALSKHGRELAVPIVAYTLMWMHDNSSRCLKEILGPPTSKPVNVVEVIKTIEGYYNGETRENVELSIEDIANGVTFSQDNYHTQSSFIRKLLARYGKLGLVDYDSVDKNEPLVTYRWNKPAPYYFMFDIMPRTKSDEIILFLYENREKKPLSGVDVANETRIFPAGDVYKVLDALVEHGCLTKVGDRKSHVIVKSTDELKTIYDFFLNVEEAVNAYFSGTTSPNYDEMKKADEMFKSSFFKNVRIVKGIHREMKQRYDKQVGVR